MQAKADEMQFLNAARPGFSDRFKLGVNIVPAAGILPFPYFVPAAGNLSFPDIVPAVLH